MRTGPNFATQRTHSIACLLAISDFFKAFQTPYAAEAEVSKTNDAAKAKLLMKSYWKLDEEGSKMKIHRAAEACYASWAKGVNVDYRSVATLRERLTKQISRWLKNATQERADQLKVKKLQRYLIRLRKDLESILEGSQYEMIRKVLTLRQHTISNRKEVAKGKARGVKGKNSESKMRKKSKRSTACKEMMSPTTVGQSFNPDRAGWFASRYGGRSGFSRDRGYEMYTAPAVEVGLGCNRSRMATVDSESCADRREIDLGERRVVIPPKEDVEETEMERKRRTGREMLRQLESVVEERERCESVQVSKMAKLTVCAEMIGDLVVLSDRCKSQLRMSIEDGGVSERNLTRGDLAIVDEVVDLTNSLMAELWDLSTEVIEECSNAREERVLQDLNSALSVATALEAIGAITARNAQRCIQLLPDSVQPDLDPVEKWSSRMERFTGWFIQTSGEMAARMVTSSIITLPSPNGGLRPDMLTTLLSMESTAKEIIHRLSNFGRRLVDTSILSQENWNKMRSELEPRISKIRAIVERVLRQSINRTPTHSNPIQAFEVVPVANPFEIAKESTDDLQRFAEDLKQIKANLIVDGKFLESLNKLGDIVKDWRAEEDDAEPSDVVNNLIEYYSYRQAPANESTFWDRAVSYCEARLQSILPIKLAESSVDSSAKLIGKVLACVNTLNSFALVRNVELKKLDGNWTYLTPAKLHDLLESVEVWHHCLVENGPAATQQPATLSAQSEEEPEAMSQLFELLESSRKLSTLITYADGKDPELHVVHECVQEIKNRIEGWLDDHCRERVFDLRSFLVESASAVPVENDAQCLWQTRAILTAILELRNFDVHFDPWSAGFISAAEEEIAGMSGNWITQLKSLRKISSALADCQMEIRESIAPFITIVSKAESWFEKMENRDAV